MAKTEFHLIAKSTNEAVKKSNTLKEIWWHIKVIINEPRSYGVLEFENGKMVDVCSAYYLIENCKHEDNLPTCLADIKKK